MDTRMDLWLGVAVSILAIGTLVRLFGSSSRSDDGGDPGNLADTVQEELSHLLQGFSSAGRHIPDAQAVQCALAKVLAAPAFAELGQMSGVMRRGMLEDVLSEIVGFGPVECLVRDGTVSEIRVDGPSTVLAVRGGVAQATDRRFRDDDHVIHLVRRFVEIRGKEFSVGQPFVQITLADGTEMVAKMPSPDICGVQLTIRKAAGQIC